MKLYYSPGACSLSPHIALAESELPFTLEKVSLLSKRTASGDDFLAINPKGYVPVLVLDDGTVLTEGPVIVQFIADQVPQKNLIPPAGTLARYQTEEWLTFINSEIHKTFGPLFHSKEENPAKVAARAALLQRFTYVASRLDHSTYLMGEQFTVADGYLFTVLSWATRVGPDLSSLPSIASYVERIAARPKVRQAMRSEGLIKA